MARRRRLAPLRTGLSGRAQIRVPVLRISTLMYDSLQLQIYTGESRKSDSRDQYQLHAAVFGPVGVGRIWSHGDAGSKTLCLNAPAGDTKT